jgi:uncharacterized protein (DUF433 family)
MSQTNTEYKHIILDAGQVPCIQGSTLKVIELVMAQRAYGWTPEEIHINHRYLTMSQIYAALSYYWDHKSELDAAIAADLKAAETLRQETGESPFVARLKAQGLLP